MLSSGQPAEPPADFITAGTRSRQYTRGTSRGSGGSEDSWSVVTVLVVPVRKFGGVRFTISNAFADNDVRSGEMHSSMLGISSHGCIKQGRDSPCTSDLQTELVIASGTHKEFTMMEKRFFCYWARRDVVQQRRK